MDAARDDELQLGRAARALGDWLGGPGALRAHALLFALGGPAMVLLALYRAPDDLGFRAPVASWAVLLGAHALVVAAIRLSFGAARSLAGASAPGDWTREWTRGPAPRPVTAAAGAPAAPAPSGFAAPATPGFAAPGSAPAPDAQPADAAFRPPRFRPRATSLAEVRPEHGDGSAGESALWRRATGGFRALRHEPASASADAPGASDPGWPDAAPGEPPGGDAGATHEVVVETTWVAAARATGAVVADGGRAGAARVGQWARLGWGSVTTRFLTEEHPSAGSAGATGGEAPSARPAAPAALPSPPPSPGPDLAALDWGAPPAPAAPARADAPPLPDPPTLPDWALPPSPDAARAGAIAAPEPSASPSPSPPPPSSAAHRVEPVFPGGILPASGGDAGAELADGARWTWIEAAAAAWLEQRETDRPDLALPPPTQGVPAPSVVEAATPAAPDPPAAARSDSPAPLTDPEPAAAEPAAAEPAAAEPAEGAVPPDPADDARGAPPA